jgi:hypothetical protein
MAVALFTLLAKGDAPTAFVIGAMAFAFAFTASMYSAEHGSMSQILECRLLALFELFVYLSTIALALGLAATNENRIFRVSTQGQERLSFFFASSPSHAAVMAGAAFVLALKPATQVSSIRRALLAGASIALVYGANYRNVAVLLVLTSVLLLLHRRRTRPDDPFRRAPRWIAVSAIAISAMPIWWPLVADAVARPAAAIFDTVPGLGARRTTVSSEQEISTLNSRTTIWSETWSLLGRADSAQLLLGYGPGTSDDEYSATLNREVGTSFGSLEFVSAHNGPLETVRRSGLVGTILIAIAVALYWRSRQLVHLGMFMSASLIIASSATDALLLPYVSAPFGVFVLVCVAPNPRSRAEPPRSNARPKALTLT